MERIASVQNTLIKDTVKLQNAKYRQAEQSFLLHGDKLITEAQRAGFVIKTIFYVQEQQIMEWTKDNIKKKSEAPRLIEVTTQIMEKLSEMSSPPNLIAVAQMKKPENKGLKECKNYILLENLQDPSNVGNIFRTAEAFGLYGIILVGSAVDIYSSKVLRGSMGSSLRLPCICYETPLQAKTDIERAKLRLYAAALDKTAVKLSSTVFSNGSVVAIGNEGRGLTQEMLKLSDEKLFIEMRGETNSLSAPIAAAVILYKMQADAFDKNSGNRV